MLFFVGSFLKLMLEKRAANFAHSIWKFSAWLGYVTEIQCNFEDRQLYPQEWKVRSIGILSHINAQFRQARIHNVAKACLKFLFKYQKVTSNNRSRLEAHFTIYRLLMLATLQYIFCAFNKISTVNAIAIPQLVARQFWKPGIKDKIYPIFGSVIVDNIAAF